jgi:hypothetical protein
MKIKKKQYYKIFIQLAFFLNVYSASNSACNNELSQNKNDNVDLFDYVTIFQDKLKNNESIKKVNQSALTFSNKLAKIISNETNLGKSIFRVYNSLFPSNQTPDAQGNNTNVLYEPDAKSWSIFTLATAAWTAYPAACLAKIGFIGFGRVCLRHRGKVLALILSSIGGIGLCAYDEKTREKLYALYS